MSDYTKLTAYDTKDALPTGDPLKRIKGTELDDEFDAISVAIATKANSASPTFTGTPIAPTPTAGDSTTKVATTAFATTAIATAIATVALPSGTLLMWPKTSAPTGFLKCDGSAVSRTTYADLYTAIGTTFGAGDGSTTFNLPDFDNRMPIGYGDLYSMAATGGSRDAVMPSSTTGTTELVGSFPTGAGTGSYYSGAFTRSTGYSGNGADPQTNYKVNFDGSHSHTFTGASQTFTAVAATDLLTMGTGWDNNVAVQLTTTGTLPTGLSLATTYYIIQADVTAKTCKLSTSVGGSAVDIASTGTGTHTMTLQGQSGVQRNLPPYLAIAFIIKT